VYESRFVVVRVRGIPIGVSWSWLLIAGFLTWWLTNQLLPQRYPGLSTGTYLAMAAASALLFFVSIVLHELGHAFRALKEGMKIEGITLWLFGGVARFLGMFPSAGAELRIAVAGPLVSVALAVLFWLLVTAGQPLGLPVPVRGVLEYLAAINVLVVIFNLVPVPPLDGSKVLFSFMSPRQVVQYRPVLEQYGFILLLPTAALTDSERLRRTILVSLLWCVQATQSFGWRYPVEQRIHHRVEIV